MGCIIVLGVCFSIALLGVVSNVNVFGPLTGLLVGLSVMLLGAGDLAFERQRKLALRLRLLAVCALVLAWVSLVAVFVQAWGAP